MNASLTRKPMTARAVAWFGLMPALAATVAFSTPSWAQEKPDLREHLSGGPTKVEFLYHRDTTRVAAPGQANLGCAVNTQ